VLKINNYQTSPHLSFYTPGQNLDMIKENEG